MPAGTTLMHLPGRFALGRTAAGSTVRVEEEGALAVAAVLPPGYLRTWLPAYEDDGRPPVLPLFGYAAVAAIDGEPHVAAMRTDRWSVWDPPAEDPPHPLSLAGRHDPHQYQWVASGRAAPPGRCRIELGQDQHLQPRRQALPRLLPAGRVRAGASRAVRGAGGRGPRPGHDQPLDFSRDQRRALRARGAGRIRPGAGRTPGAAAEPERRSALAAGPDPESHAGHRYANLCPGAHGALPRVGAWEFHPAVAGS